MLSDSAILLHRFSPYESNYIRLRAFAPVLVELGGRAGRFISHVPGDVPLHVALCERSRYTTTLHMTYFFEQEGELVPDPDLSVRIYHDARMAEALAEPPAAGRLRDPARLGAGTALVAQHDAQQMAGILCGSRPSARCRTVRVADGSRLGFVIWIAPPRGLPSL